VTVPPQVHEAWGWRAEQIAPLPGGLINETYVVRDGDPVAVVQRQHPAFGPDVTLDIDAVTAHLAARGLETPRLIRTRDGAPCVLDDGRVWRALTWIEGESVHSVPEPAWAEVAGALVGRFHRAVADLVHDYRFVRTGVHDTRMHLTRLDEHVAASHDAEPTALGREILAAGRALPELPVLARRHVHGDLKISNVRFRRAPLGAAALVDLDTLALGTLAFELGDAMRSWCNPHGEDASSVVLELPIFASAIAGFRAVADPITTETERRSIVTGLETVCVELAARFCVDVFEDRYFGWDAARFPSRRAHNLARARAQLALGLAVRAARAEALEIVLG
jgi:Ser/Thr protein kinase RdoA (MazF antagonist)